MGKTWAEGFENEVLRKIFVPKREEVTGGRKNCVKEIFIVVLLLPRYEDGQVKEDEIGGAPGTYGKKKFVLHFGTEI